MSTVPSAAKVTEIAFLAILWSGTAISLCATVFRLFVRIKYFQRVFVDDLLVVAAWTMLLVTAILWQIESPTLYKQYAIAAGKEPFSPEFLDQDKTFLRTLAPLTILFYSCLWTVKLSFLFFFRRLGSKVRGHNIWWWCIFVITMATWVACIADTDYQCFLGSLTHIFEYCPSLTAIHYDDRTFLANCAADVITDCLIVSIPVLMLWHVRIPLQKKLILIGIFSITVVVMIVSIIRVAVVYSYTHTADISWLYLWSSIEMATTIIIACIASFRQLFITSQNQHQYGKSNDSVTGKGLLYYFRSRFRTSDKSISRGTGWPSTKSNSSAEKQESQTQIVPLNTIHVSQNVDISHTTSDDEANFSQRPYEFELVSPGDMGKLRK